MARREVAKVSIKPTPTAKLYVWLLFDRRRTKRTELPKNPNTILIEETIPFMIVGID